MDGTAEPSAPVTGMILRKVPSSDMVVPALTRGFAILDLVAKNPGLDFTSIHGRLGLPKSSTHNLLSTLSRLGLVRMRPDRGFVLGLKLTELGAFAASHRFVEAESLPLLRALASELQLTCHLGVSEGAEAVYLSKIDCDQPIRVESWVGKRFSLHSSALGKVLLALAARRRATTSPGRHQLDAEHPAHHHQPGGDARASATGPRQRLGHRRRGERAEHTLRRRAGVRPAA